MLAPTNLCLMIRSASSAKFDAACITVGCVSFKSIGLDDACTRTSSRTTRPLDLVLTDLLAETHGAWPEDAGLSIAPEQAPFLTFLARLVGARPAVEIGTFTGVLLDLDRARARRRAAA